MPSGRLFSEISFNLSGLMEQVVQGTIALPDLQRPFVWPNTKVRDLFDSMYKGYPVGYLLFWENGGVDGAKGFGLDPKQQPPRLLVIDGQQRLTSLYAVLRGRKVKRHDFSEEHIQIAFRPTDGAFDVADAAIRKDPSWIADISVIWNPETSLFRFVKDYLARLTAARALSDEEQLAVEEAISRLKQLESFPFTALSLASQLDEEQVADVFVRINSKGTPLNQADFILTLMSVFQDHQRTELEDFCRRSRVPSASGLSPFNYFLEPEPDHLLRVSVGLGFRRARLSFVYSILRGKDLETGEFSTARREQQFGILEAAQTYTLDLQNWKDLFQCLLRAGFRSGGMITSKNAVLFTYVFYLIGRRDYGLDRHRLRNAIARWFYFVTLTGRYTNSPESRMEQDLADLREIADGEAFLRHLEAVIQSHLTPDFWAITLPNDLATSAARSPGLFAYYAALNRLDARALFSPMRVRELLDPATRGHRSALERHHLFPKAYLQKKWGSSQRDTNQIANYALIEWPDNAKIGERAPDKYFPELVKRAKTARERKEMAFWHALPEGWETMSYPRFLEQRRILLAQVIRAGFDNLAQLSEEETQAEPFPAFHPGHLGVIAQALARLSPALAEHLGELLEEPSCPAQRLRSEVLTYLGRLEAEGLDNPRIDLGLARQLGQRCLHLLDRSSETLSADQMKLIQAGVSYFTSEEDAEPDLESREGFRDDEQVISAVEGVLIGEAGGERATTVS